MANYRNHSRRPIRKKSKYSKTEKLAFQMGQIKRGLANPNSKVHASYQNGLKGTTRTKTKPMF